MNFFKNLENMFNSKKATDPAPAKDQEKIFASPQKAADLTPVEVGDFVKQATYANIFRSKKDGRVFIKKDLRLPGFDTETDPLYTLNEFKINYQRALKFLKENFQEYLPAFQLVWGRDKTGNEAGYVLTEEVVEETDKAYEQQRLYKLDEFLSHAIRVWLNNKNEEGEACFPDLKGEHNYIFGRIKNQPAPKLYLVDAFPIKYLWQKSLEEEVNFIMHANPGFAFPRTAEILQEIKNIGSEKADINKRVVKIIK